MNPIKQATGILLIAVLAMFVFGCSPTTDGDGGGSDGEEVVNGSARGLAVKCNLDSTKGRSIGMYVWVTDVNGNYICTINYYSGGGGLLKYNDGTGYNDTPAQWIGDSGASSGKTIDGISRASQTVSGNYTFISNAWDFTDASSNEVGNGTYRIHVNVCAENIQTAYFHADIDIDGSGKTVPLQVSGSSTIMTDGSVTYNP